MRRQTYATVDDVPRDVLERLARGTGYSPDEYRAAIRRYWSTPVVVAGEALVVTDFSLLDDEASA